MEAALAVRDHRGAYDAALHAIEVLPAWAPATLPTAIRAALWGGDLDRVADAARRLDEIRYGDPVVVEARMWAAAILAALEGRRDDAVLGFGRAAAILRELGLEFELARMGIDMLIALGPDDREARAAADEARPILERLGARPYLDRLEAAVSSGPDTRRGQPASEAVPASEPTTARPA
jgi:hypothetical protein